MRDLRLTITRDEQHKGTQFVFHKDKEIPDPNKCTSFIWFDDDTDVHSFLKMINQMYLTLVEHDLTD